MSTSSMATGDHGRRGKSSPTKRKLPQPASPASSDNDDNDTVENCTDDASAAKKAKGNLDLTLTKAEVGQLLANVQSALPKHDAATHKATMEKIPWEAIKLPKHSGAECKQQWEVITKKIRKYRTMTEVNEEALTLANTGKLMQMLHHADMPKKPLTAFFMFMQKTRKKVLAKNPGISFQELSKIVTEKYHSLPAKKMKKFVDKAAQMKAKYDSDMAKFKEDHPDFKNDQQPKTTTPLAIFLEEKVTEAMEKEPEKSKKDLQVVFREKWAALSMKKRLKYFNRAIEAKKQYDIDVAEYQKLYPDYRPPISSKGFLSKQEWKLKEEYEGKPQKPPANGLALFCMEKMSTMKDVEPKQRMPQARDMWKALTQAERDSYKLKASTKVQAYNTALEEYIKTLPEEEQEKAREENKIVPRQVEKKKKTAAKKKSPAKKPSGISLFMIEKMPEYKEVHPSMDETAIARMLVKEFSALHDSEKEKYDAVEVKKPSVDSHHKNMKVQLFPGEPKRPVSSGYQLYCSEFMSSQKDLKGTEKMREASRRWKAMSDKEKKVYNTKKDKLIAQYEKDFAKFKKNLTPIERKRYDEARQKPEVKNEQKKKAPVKEESSEESSSEEDSSSEEEDDDDDDDDGSKKDSSDDSESSDDSDSESEESDSE